MELILFDTDFKEIGPVRVNVDFEIGDGSALNDFEISPAAPLNAHGIYIPDTEWGGIFEYEDSTSGSDSVTLKGWTFRGLLTQDIIEPPSGGDYRTVSGEANTILRSILSDVLGGFFTVPETDSGLVISTYQFRLYTTVLEGLTDMLAEYGYRLKICAGKEAAGGNVRVYAEAVPVKKMEEEYNGDQKIRLRFVNNRMGINHLVCMGSGQLQERQRVDLYMQPGGNISQEQYYTGLAERTAYYDYAGAQSLSELIKYGTERLRSIAGTRLFEMTAEGVELEVGDIAVGRHRATGTIVEKQIVRKILKITNGYVTVEYKVKGEE